ncbi:MAG: crotonase/enoyl-CoA hydratase family protein [Pseudomonadota bacterium]
MDSPLVEYHLADGVATIAMDDGKRNALSPSLLHALRKAIDRAEQDRALIILTGREDVFSAGFDLKVMRRGGAQALGMLRAGYGMTARVMSYPYPVIAACSGHAMAMGVFLMLSADHVIGSRGDFKISANEVALGLTMPRVAALTLKHRLTPAAYQRAVTLSTFFDVEEALVAGFFDQLADPSELQKEAQRAAEDYKALDPYAHRRSKRRIRAATLRKIRLGLPLDLLDAVWLGIRGTRPR